MLLSFLATLALQAEQTPDPTVCTVKAAWEEVGEGDHATLMIVRQRQEDFDNGDEVLIGFYNEDWSISEGQKLGVIKVTGSNGSWISHEAVATKNGFFIWAEYSYVAKVFGSTSMSITRQGKTIDALRLNAMNIDWFRFQTCRDKKVAVKTERERLEKLRKVIPKDPFAP